MPSNSCKLCGIIIVPPARGNCDSMPGSNNQQWIIRILFPESIQAIGNCDPTPINHSRMIPAVVYINLEYSSGSTIHCKPQKDLCHPLRSPYNGHSIHRRIFASHMKCTISIYFIFIAESNSVRL